VAPVRISSTGDGTVRTAALSLLLTGIAWLGVLVAICVDTK